MYFIDGKQSTIVSLLVGTGGITKGDMCKLSSGTIVKVAAGDNSDDLIGLAVADAVDTAMGSVELAGDRIIRSPYAGTASNLATCKLYDFTDADTINIDDVTNGSCFCVGYNSTNGTVDFILSQVSRHI
jgi:hypothetical protein